MGLFCVRRSSCEFKSNVRETWCVILVSKADIFHTESLRISVAFVPFHVTGKKASRIFRKASWFKLPSRFELPTSALPRRRSTS